MALEYVDSFGYGSVAQLSVAGGGFWDAVPDTNNITYGASGTGRWGGVTRYLRLGQNNAYIEKNFSSVARRIVGLSVWLQQIITNAHPVFRFYDDTTLQVEVRVTTTGEIEVLQNTTQRGITSGLNLLLQNWHYIEVDVTIDNSTGACTVRVNGVPVLTLTSIDTQTSANATTNRLRLSSIANNNATFDTRIGDLYVLNTAGGVNDALLGDSRVEMLVPNGSGNSTQFTPSSGNNWERVNERATSDGDSSYVESLTPTNIDLYAMSALEAASGDIKGAMIKVFARKTDVVSREIGLGLRSAGTNSFDSGHVLASGFQYHSRLMDINPVSAAAFTYAEINALEVGQSVTV